MRLGKRRVLLCSCEDTMTLDGPRLAESLEAEGAPQLCRQLCRSEIATLLEAARDSEDGLLVACTQEGLTFQEQLEAAQELFQHTRAERAPSSRKRRSTRPWFPASP